MLNLIFIKVQQTCAAVLWPMWLYINW